jgi:hypothetical protein
LDGSESDKVQGNAEAALYLKYLLCAKVKRVAEEGPYKRVFFDMYQRLSDYSARYNANTGEQMSWFFSVLMEGLARDLDEKACLRMAKKVANPPPDAVLETCQYEEQGDEPVFVARWGHRHKGVPVERDYIQVLVNGKTGHPFSLHRKWHSVDTKQTVR